MRDYVVSGLVREETVNEILALRVGEPMVTEEHFWARTPFRCWTRLRKADGQWTRNLGEYRATVQEAADDLVAKLRARGYEE
jgi:hypothetical protein